MALIKEVRGHTPVIGENTFLAETAVILGDVTIGRDCSIWYNAVLRGDVNKIVIGDRTNIQDGVVLHTIYDKAKHPSQTIIGNDVSVGHNAIVHGAVIGDNCLIGMGATLWTMPSSPRAASSRPMRWCCRTPSWSPIRSMRASRPRRSRR